MSVQTTADVHNVNIFPSFPAKTVRSQMNTDKPIGQERGMASSSVEESSSGGVRFENPELQAQEPVEFRGEVRGGQSLYGGVHLVANETLLTSRAPSTSSSF